MSILYAFESIRTGFLTFFESIWSFLGEEAFLFALVAIIYWCVDKSFARRIGFSAILFGNFSIIIKNIACVLRPSVAYDGFRAASSIFAKTEGYSMPSLHTSIAVGIASNFFYKYRLIRVRLICVLVMIMVPISRMYLGTNTLADVIVAFFIAAIISFFLNHFIDGMVIDRGHYPIMCLGLATLPLFSFVIFLSQYYNEIIDYATGISAVRFAGGSIAFALSWIFEENFVRFNEKCDHTWKQFVKAGIGLLISFILKLVFDSVISIAGHGVWPLEFLEYFVLVFVAIAVYPLCFERFFAANY